jgi:hypothetical protein
MKTPLYAARYRARSLWLDWAGREAADRVPERDRRHRLAIRKRFAVRGLELLGIQLLFLRSFGHGRCVPSRAAADTRRQHIGGTMPA